MTAIRAIVGNLVLALLGRCDLALKQCTCGCGDLYRGQM